MADGGFWSRFAAVAEQIAPIALKLTPLAPIAPAVQLGILEAEQLANASGTEKLAHALNLASTAALAANAQAGKTVVDPTYVQQQGALVISGVVQAVNAVKAVAHPAALTQAALPGGLEPMGQPQA
jgi:hypothetical protein